MPQASALPAPPALLRALEAYGDGGLGDPRITPLAGGLLHTSYAVDAAGREYIAQRVNPVFSPRIHDNIHAVTRHLAERGLESFELVPTGAGQPFVDLGADGRWRLLTRLPGRAFDVCQGPEQARSAAALIARFHSALGDFAAELQPLGFPYHDTALHLAELERALAQHGEHPRHADVAAIAREVARIAASLGAKRALPQRVIHGDLKFSNVLFEVGSGSHAARVERASALIDFDTLCRLPLYFDLGDAWRSWCNPRGEDEPEALLDMAIFRASAEGYLDALALELSPAERDSLAEGLERLSLELCARFAADVLSESYFAWDSARFASAADHNLVRARGQLSLCRQARETHSERLRLLVG